MQKPPHALEVYALSGVESYQISPAARTFWYVASVASAAASGFHGYRRNNSVGWAVGWFLLGGLFPIITPVVAVAQGYAKPAKK